MYTIFLRNKKETKTHQDLIAIKENGGQKC